MERARTDISSDLLRRAREMAEARGSDEREDLEELIEESFRLRRFPGIAFRDGPAGRRARVLGAALDVWEVIEAYQQMGEERLRSESYLSERQVDLALRAAHRRACRRLPNGEPGCPKTPVHHGLCLRGSSRKRSVYDAW